MRCNLKKLSYTPDKTVLQNIINSWSKLAKGEELNHNNFDLFVRFISSWVAFNAIYEMTCSSVNGDRNKVREFAKIDDAQSLHIALLDNEGYKDAVDVLADKGILKLPRARDRQLIENINSLEEVLLCVYQVRCNLFHGGKTPENPRDREVVSAALMIVSSLINPFVEKINKV
jgi:CRISPR/Cas system CSM-associated protein Csm2 small subunit